LFVANFFIFVKKTIMIRETIIATSDSYTIHFPKEWIGKRVSVIYDEEEEFSTPNKPMENSKSEIIAFYNKINLNFSDFTFNRNEANER
jgi:putative transposon-encoded protein